MMIEFSGALLFASNPSPPCVPPSDTQTLTPWEVDLSGLASAVNQVNTAISSTGACSIRGTSLPKLSISRIKSYACCDDNVKEVISYNGSAQFTIIQGNCSVPVYGITGFATVNVNVGAGLGGAISVDLPGSCSTSRADVCATVSGNLSIDVGVSVELANGYISGSLSGGTGGDATGSWCKSGGGSFCGFIGGIDLTGSVTAGNWYTKSITYHFSTGGGFSATF